MPTNVTSTYLDEDGVRRLWGHTLDAINNHSQIYTFDSFEHLGLTNDSFPVNLDAAASDFLTHLKTILNTVYNKIGGKSWIFMPTDINNFPNFILSMREKIVADLESTWGTDIPDKINIIITKMGEQDAPGKIEAICNTSNYVSIYTAMFDPSNNYPSTSINLRKFSITYRPAGFYGKNQNIQINASTPKFTLRNTDASGTNKCSEIRQYTNATTISAYNSVDETADGTTPSPNTKNGRRIRIQDSDNESDFKKSLVYQDIINGNYSTYNIYHEGNATPNDLMVYSLKDATEIPTGTDLNEFLTFGNYFINSDGAKTLKNCPTQYSFVLHNERSAATATGSTYRKQKIVPYNTNHEWWRTKTGSSSWTAWQSNFKNNPNLLDNWYWLDPVNTRGKTIYTNTSAGSMDRWYTSTTMQTELLENGIKFTNTSTSSSASILQYTANGYKNGTYTLSALVTDITMVEGSNITMYFSKDNNYSCSGTDVRTINGTGLFRITGTITDGTFNRVRFQVPVGTSVTIAAVKLEEGNGQTLANMDKDGNWVVNNAPIKEHEAFKCSMAKISNVTDTATGFDVNEIYSLNRATAITEGDLDNLPFGNYYCSSSYTQNIANIPEPYKTGTSYGFVLKVERTTYSTTKYCKQRFISYNSPGGKGPTEYWRTNVSGKWGNWTQVVTDKFAGTLNVDGKIYVNTEPDSSDVAGTVRAVKIHGAVWNDYAEYREADTVEPGRVVVEKGDDTLILASERLQPGANIVSDTFGFSIGETETAKTPLAVSGRVLAYTYEDRNSYQPGDAVCAAPNGTVSKMTREEIMHYPERIIGTVSSVPSYEIWGTGEVKVNGRIWIKVR